jgi:hypothetical protein
MKTIVLLTLAVLAAVAFAQGPTLQTYFGHTLYNLDLLTAYQSNPSTNPPYLPPVDEEQLCYLVGAISGCSGCQWGTQDLCRWVGQSWGPAGEFFQCVPRTSAQDLEAFDVVYDASYQCPSDPEESPVYTDTLFTASGPIVPEVASLIHNTYHEMLFGEVEYKPWPVDRTSLYSEHGALNVFGLNDALLRAAGDFVRPEVTCATLNDPEALDMLLDEDSICNIPPLFAFDADYPLKHRVVDELVQGLLGTENDVFCLKAIWGAYLSTRCPEYGVAVSGISYSLYRSFYDNCSPFPWRSVHIGPTMVQLPVGNTTVGVPYSIFALPIVPDGTPFSLSDITIPVSNQFEDWSEIDEIDVDVSYYVENNEYDIFGYSNLYCPNLGA